jgi:hypothetical protein
MIKKLLIGLIICFCTGSMAVKAQNQVSFFEEHIDFALDKRYFTINGIYSFSNSTDRIVRQKIIFPFAKNGATVDSIRIFDLNKQRTLLHRQIKDAVVFDISVLPNDTLDVNIFYRQTRLPKNIYIITSTKVWGKPLKKAFYSLTLPRGEKATGFSYKPDSTSINKHGNVYFWRKSDFLPDNEFEFEVRK